MFAKIKNFLKSDKDERSKSNKSNRLGGAEPTIHSVKPKDSVQPSEYVISFMNASLGLEFDKFGKQVIVSSVANHSEAESKGVRIGDVVLSIEGEDGESAAEVNVMIQTSPRPLSIKFKRLFKVTDEEVKQSQPQSQSLFDKMTGKKPEIPIAEREHRRAVMAQAAAQRETKNLWDKPVKSVKPQSSLDDLSESTDNFEYSEETLRVIDRVKNGEVQIIKELGYNPFVPVIASSNNTGGGSVSHASSSSSQTLDVPASFAPAAPTSPRASQQLQEMWTAYHDELVESLFDEALALLLSISGNKDGTGDTVQQDIVSTCVATTSKMLDNIKNNPKEPKFRSIRVQNANFNAKVYSIPGGPQLFTAAGFQLHTNRLDVGDNAAVSEPEESYLKHDMSFIRTKMLVYVNDRLKALQLDA